MISDIWYRLTQWWKQLFCHHEYICKTVPNVFEPITYYKCRKCGHVTFDPPESLVIFDDK